MFILGTEDFKWFYSEDGYPTCDVFKAIKFPLLKDAEYYLDRIPIPYNPNYKILETGETTYTVEFE